MLSQVQIPEHVRRFLQDELGFDAEDVDAARECTSIDYEFLLDVILLSDEHYYDYRIYHLDNGWHILHAWVPTVGNDWAIVARYVDGILDACWVVEE